LDCEAVEHEAVDDEAVDRTYLLENSRLEPPRSCDGEPAPERVLPAILPAFKAPRKGDLRDPAPLLLLLLGSVGEVLAVDEPERGRPGGK
jgi:hypothetical protein